MAPRYERLADGALLVVRPIRADDKQLLASGLRELSERTVQRRFLTAKPQLSAAELRYLTELDGHEHFALVAEQVGAPGRRLVGVARFVRSAERPDEAEAAVVVGDSWQGRGVGSLLGARLAEVARGKGIQKFTATILSENVPAQRLMQKLTRQLERGAGGTNVSEFVADLAA